LIVDKTINSHHKLKFTAMKSVLFFSLSFFVINSHLFSQETTAASPRAQSVYLEFLGNGLVFSGNYDFRFQKSQKGLGMRVGLGFFGGSGGGIITLPIGLNYLTGKGPNYFEAGLGYTYASFTDSEDFLEGSGSILVPSIGYRYQPVQKGFIGRIYIGPLIGISGGGGWIFYGGLSGGFKF
jgi:hypothetical protein